MTYFLLQKAEAEEKPELMGPIYMTSYVLMLAVNIIVFRKNILKLKMSNNPLIFSKSYFWLQNYSRVPQSLEHA